MASIGGVSCSIVRGVPAGMKQRTRTWQKPGIDGYGAIKLGSGDSATRFAVVKYDSQANVLTWVAAIGALQGTVVTVINDWGTSYTKFLVRRVSQPTLSPAVQEGGVRGEITIEGVIHAA